MFLKTIVCCLLICAAFSDPEMIDAIDLAFFKLGSYENGDTYKKDFFISRHFKIAWQESRAVCKSFGMEFVSLDTEDEYKKLHELLASNAVMVGQYNYIGAMTTDPRNYKWYWLNSGKRVSFPLKWARNEPTNAGEEFCLVLEKVTENEFHFHDGSCNTSHGKFICQKEHLAVVFEK